MTNRADFRERKSKADQAPFFYRVIWLPFLGAIAALVCLYLYGPSTFQVLQTSVISIGVKIDLLSSLFLTLVSLLGVIIGLYSKRYLYGEARQSYFYRYLFLALISASGLAISSNLIMIFATWLGMSLSLHKLLIFFPERPKAVSAAQKKFIVSRIGDFFLISAIGLTFYLFKTFELDELFSLAQKVQSETQEAYLLGFVGILFALGALTKSVQVPFHFWLPETMETPTPVSALMHAGIINAGGYLMIRLSPLFQEAFSAQILLTIVGATTAVFGSLVMITQNDIKRKLAYSTISQMGVMMFTCGIGAYSIAFFHILAHSLYKSYAFLSTGLQIEEAKKISLKLEQPSKFYLSCTLGTGLFLVGFGTLYQAGLYLPYFTYGAILLLGFFQIGTVQYSNAGLKYIVPKVLVLTVSSLAVCLFFEYLIHEALNHSSPLPSQTISSYFAFAIFGIGYWINSLIMKPRSLVAKKLYIYFWNGGYFQQITDSLLKEEVVSREAKQKQKFIYSTENVNA